MGKTEAKNPKKLEDYEPGATKPEIFEALKKVVKSSKPSQKNVQPPDSTS